jgi:hypothetical protein
MALRVACIDGASPLIGVSQTYCAGSYRCPDPAGDQADVTSRTEWTVEHPQSVRQTHSCDYGILSPSCGPFTISLSNDQHLAAQLDRASSDARFPR